MTIIKEVEYLRRDPAGFIAGEVRRFVSTSPSNRLTALGNEQVFDEPLVGFADGDDPLFRDYKSIVGDFHLTPREALEQCGNARPAKVSVVSIVFPFTAEIRLSLRQESQVASLPWNHARWKGQEVIDTLAEYLVGLFARLGHLAVSPDRTKLFGTRITPTGMTSNWSQRHIAYAAGLGTFSLNDGFITRRGIAMRCGSVVTDAVLPASSRPYTSHTSNCLFYVNGSCRRCIERCPAGAISEKGHDKVRCRDFLANDQPAILKSLGRGAGYIGRSVGCGLCQTKVPCEDRVPPSRSGGQRDQPA